MVKWTYSKPALRRWRGPLASNHHLTVCRCAGVFYGKEAQRDSAALLPAVTTSSPRQLILPFLVASTLGAGLPRPASASSVTSFGLRRGTGVGYVLSGMKFEESSILQCQLRHPELPSYLCYIPTTPAFPCEEDSIPYQNSIC